jgi:hypothetical protein
MNIYHSLLLQEEATNCILFPLGLLSFPDEELQVYRAGREIIQRMVHKHFPTKLAMWKGPFPIVVFKQLSADQWKNTKPHSNLCEAYLTRLAEAVEVMNSAGVAHMDHRPANVMWCCVNDVEIQIIDFEDALGFGTLISVSAHLQSDCHYPFPNLGIIKVSVIHNRWFLAAITSCPQNLSTSRQMAMDSPNT